MNPVLAFEYLFFAVFGQTTHGELKVETNQPQWTSVLFKLTFGVYMLVSVVVLINLLIAMMSDTYQRIQAQSDIEWKYGLSKLIRNMHRTTTAPSPLNLLTTWIVYFIKVCKQHARSKMGAKWLAKVKKGQVRPKDSVTLSVVHLSPLGSQLSFNSATRLESVVDWDSIRKKYLALSGSELHKQIEEHKIYRGTQSFHETYRSHIFPVRMSPVLAVELLFFAIFGQTTHEQFKVEKTQPEWTKVLFKLTFGIYMLVSVVVLINLLIAMMSDTYQRIQAQSDIEWKYGLSKLVRNMHRTSTAPSPLNLLTTWMAYLYKLCKKRAAKKQRPSLVRLMGLQRTDALSARSRMGAKWLSKVKKAQVAHKDSVALSVVHLSPLGSQLSFSNVVRIDNVVDWEAVRHKYRDLYGENIEKHVEESKESTDHESLPTVLESSLAGVPVTGSQTALTSIP